MRKLALADAREGNVCSFCLGLEWVREDRPFGHANFGKMFPCVCQKGRMTEYLKRASGLTGGLLNHRLEDYTAKERAQQYEAVQRLLNKGFGWLVLWGGYGKGKTFLLSSVVNHYLVSNRPAVYTTTADLLDSLRQESFSKTGIGFENAIAQWRDCKVLAIDELESYYKTPWGDEKLRRILDYRYRLATERDLVNKLTPQSKPITLFACNVEPGGESWPDGLEWLYDRMRQFEIVEAIGPSVRPLMKEAP